MIREILFKAKRIDNGEWVEGSYYKQDYFYGDEVEKHIIITSSDALTNDFDLDFYEVIPETLCEFTGRYDKNGKRIWENDIVHLTDVRYDAEWRAIVEFGNPYGEYTWGWNFYHIGAKAKVNTDILLWAEMEDVGVYCEVIGNHFDNHELLTAERSDYENQ